MKKKMICLILSLSMCITLCVPVFASDKSEARSNSSISHTTNIINVSDMSVEQRKNAFQTHIDEVTTEVLAQNGTRGNLGYSKTEYGTVSTNTIQGYPGDQPTRGYSFGPLGGTVYFTETGGPTVTVSINANLADYLSVSIAIPLGKMTSTATGYGCNIPGSSSTSPAYYKVYETKTVTISPYVVYWRQTNLDPWQVARRGEHVEIVSVRADAVKS